MQRSHRPRSPRHRVRPHAGPARRGDSASSRQLVRYSLGFDSVHGHVVVLRHRVQVEVLWRASTAGTGSSGGRRCRWPARSPRSGTHVLPAADSRCGSVRSCMAVGAGELGDPRAALRLDGAGQVHGLGEVGVQVPAVVGQLVEAPGVQRGLPAGAVVALRPGRSSSWPRPGPTDTRAAPRRTPPRRRRRPARTTSGRSASPGAGRPAVDQGERGDHAPG